MTARTMLEKVRHLTECKNDAALAAMSGLSSSVVCRVLAGKYGRGMRVETLQKIAQNSGIGIGELAEMWAEEEINARRKA